nr:hypothetical protein [Tanacetum cinerariifolium]
MRTSGIELNSNKNGMLPKRRFFFVTHADESSYPEQHLLIGVPASRPRQILTGQNIKEGESSRGASVYVPQWTIPLPCRVDTPERCRELMVHLAPSATQEESNALTNDVVGQRAWFSLARGAMAQTDILERFENLLANYDTLADTQGCKRGACWVWAESADFKERENYLSAANHDQAARIQSLEAELARKYSTLTYAEKMLVEGVKDREKLTAQLGQAEIEKFDCIRKFLSTVKLYPMYDKLFEKKYPYVEKISRGYRHSVTDLLRVHPDLAPSTSTSTPTISKDLGGSGAPPKKKT